MEFSHHFLLLLLFTILLPILAIFLLRHRIWCNCHICTAYQTSSWASDFPNLSDWYTHLLRTSPTQTIHIHIIGNTVTANPAVVEHILRARFDNYPKGKKFSRILGDLLGMGIFNVDGPAWDFQRKHASMELGSVSIRTFAFETVKGEIEQRLLPLLSSFAGKVGPESEALLDLQEVFQRFSFDNVCNFSFGFDPGCLDLSLPISPFADSFDLASKLSAERALVVSPIVWKIKRLLNVGSERRLRDAVAVVKALAMDVIEHKRKLGFSEHGDLLSRFMGCVSDEVYLRDIVMSFVLAGRDTMASAMTAFFWLIRARLDIVSRIRKEADNIIRNRNGQAFPSFDQLKEMHYLQATVYESLRLYPPVQFDSKFASEDDELPDGTFVSRGTRVMYHPYAMGRMEKIWGPDCMEFRPERWLDENGKFVHQNPYKYPVFQAGVRVCLGKEMAIVEMKMVALSVLWEFDVVVIAPISELRFEPGLTAFVRGGLKVLIKKRDTAPNNKNI
ncbi:cytochrome P450 94C1-like [Punica granatum]|uniref:Uncharacterized protein n=2 Tax=Punica granatum TaxID=22663 RepID=A0A218VVC9_PUNGR|nr:cytochrome P450 94C1-like [Punica granatum]OWM64040.1 hypothetical protein CDL15_Pgr011494 [Punica granatum]PKH47839.1 hypothetical protein CRG98_050424 [Punica granatum]